MQYKKQKQFRYKGYDYSQDGFYFITICTKDREMFFGDIKNVGTGHCPVLDAKSQPNQKIANGQDIQTEKSGTGYNGRTGRHDGTGQCPVPTVELSGVGLIAEKFWQEIPNHFSSVILHESIVMPNHIHGIIEICNNMGTGRHDGTRRHDGTGQCPVPTEIVGGSKFGQVTSNSISTIVGSYKSIVTKAVNLKFSESGFSWQSRFYDRVVRNEDELNNIRQYIINNPAKWFFDRNNLDSLYM